jgi:hypothetical protein
VALAVGAAYRALSWAVVVVATCCPTLFLLDVGEEVTSFYREHEVVVDVRQLLSFLAVVQPFYRVLEVVVDVQPSYRVLEAVVDARRMLSFLAVVDVQASPVLVVVPVPVAPLLVFLSPVAPLPVFPVRVEP